MAYIRKRGNAYQVELCINGDKFCKTFSTKKECSQWALDRQSEVITNKQKFGTVPNFTFGKLLERYSKEISIEKRGAKWEQIRIIKLLSDPLASVKLPELNETHIAAWRDRSLKKISAASVLREWNLLSAACSIAVNEWKWLDSHPMKRVRRPKSPEARDRRISDGEQSALLFVLGYRKDIPLKTQTARIGAAFLFAIETAMRVGEILSLTWDKIDFAHQVARLDETKNGTRREVPLSTEAVRILRQLKESSEGNEAFHIKKATFDALFRKAKAKAVIEDLHFHDARHEAITRLAKKLEVLELARMVGHRNLNQLLTYYNATAGELAKKLG